MTTTSRGPVFHVNRWIQLRDDGIRGDLGNAPGVDGSSSEAEGDLLEEVLQEKATVLRAPG